MQNREIKFRAWHKEYKKMLTVYVIHKGTYSEGFVKNCQGYVPPNDQYYFKFDEAEWMQYTCLKDKNGIEIYEGDLLKISEGHHSLLKKIFKVTFFIGAFGFQIIGSDGNKGYSSFINYADSLIQNDFDGDLSSYIEVIGNIHQNPDLLK